VRGAVWLAAVSFALLVGAGSVAHAVPPPHLKVVPDQGLTEKAFLTQPAGGGPDVYAGNLYAHYSLYCPYNPDNADHIPEYQWFVTVTFVITANGPVQTLSGASFGSGAAPTGIVGAGVVLPPNRNSEAFTMEVYETCGGQKIGLTSVHLALSRNASPPPPQTPSLVLSTTNPAKGKIAVGQRTPVDVKVTAVGGAIHGITLGLSTDPAKLPVLETEQGLSGFSLAKGASRTFGFGLKGIESGLVRVVGHATGTDADGKAVSGSSTIAIRIGKSVSITIGFLPGAVEQGIPLGKTAALGVLVTAGPVDLTSVSLGRGITSSSGNLTVAQAPGLAGFSLAAGESRRFMFQITNEKGGASIMSVRVTAGSAEGNVSAAATLPVQGLLTIEGTVVRAVPGCSTAVCPPKPFAGATVAAAGAAGGGTAVTGADGSYSIDVPEGGYTVSASLANHAFAPSSRTVTVHGVSAAKVNFTACPVKEGTSSANALAFCQGPQLVVAPPSITSTGIELRYQGTGWDPKGGPIRLSFSGIEFNVIPAALNFTGTLSINRWPKRTTVEAAAARQIPNGYCWGEMAARQGASFASSGIVQGKASGWVVYSGDPAIQAHQSFCEGEDALYFRKSAHTIVAFGIFERGLFGANGLNFGVGVFNLISTGQTLLDATFGPGKPLTIHPRDENVCVTLSMSPSSIVTITRTPGSCPPPAR
jgi:hypothetical protein